MASRNGRPRVAIVGAGFGGIGAAIRLREQGLADVTIFEKADDLGGTWRENTYPGAACDVPSHLYSYSFAPNPDWSRRYVGWEEILAYLRRVATEHGVFGLIRTGTEVLSAAWDGAAALWRLDLSSGETFEAEYLVCATGQLSRPAPSRLPGIEKFEGRQFHSAHWDHEYDLHGKRVAVVGTGASAIQFVPEIAPKVAEMKVYQRTPPYVIHKPEITYPGWLKRAFKRLPFLMKLGRARIYLTFELLNLGFIRHPPMRIVYRYWSRRQMRRAGVWDDPELHAKLMPDYEIGCKRALISNDYYPALLRDNVELVTDPIAEVRPHSVLTASGAEFECDAIIHGTGFSTHDFLAPMRVIGRNGQELNEAWTEGANAYLGMTVHGFPNMFILYGPNTNLGGNSIIFMLESQIRHVLAAVSAVEGSGARAIEVSADAQSRMDATVQTALGRTVWNSGCTSWYVDETGRNTNNWPFTTLHYRRLASRVDMDDYALDTGEREPDREPALSP